MRAPHPRATRSVLAVTFAALALLSACSKSGSDSEKTTTTAAKATTTTTKATTTTEAKTTTTGSTGSGDESSADPWSANAVEHRGQDGKTFSYECPAKGTPGTIWGTETYTDDSSVCTAGVHVGLITVADGGTVEIEIAPGLDEYSASEGNGIVSNSYGSWAGSFTFPDAPPGSGTFGDAIDSWSVTADTLKLDLGETAEVTCGPNGQTGSIYGTGTYTSDSYVCTAAVHAGLITTEDGGPVKIELVKGLDEYEGSTAHGVTSSPYGAFDPAFTFTDDQPEPK